MCSRQRTLLLIVTLCAAAGVTYIARAADRGASTTRPSDARGKQFWAKVVITQMRDGKPVTWAEPTLCVFDGQRGSFLAGGELPVDLGLNDGRKVDYIQFGTRVEITIHQLAPDQLRVNAWFNVSAIDPAGVGKETTIIPESGVRVIKTIKPGDTLEADLPATAGEGGGPARHVTVKIRPA